MISRCFFLGVYGACLRAWSREEEEERGSIGKVRLHLAVSLVFD